MWVENVFVEAGPWLAGVRCDSVETADAVRNTFGDRAMTADGIAALCAETDIDVAALGAALRLRAPARNGREHSLAQLHINSSLLARRRTLGGPDGALTAMTTLIDGLGRYPQPDAPHEPAAGERLATPVGTRLFVDDSGAALLVNVPQPMLVDDRWLLDRGIRELVCWQPWVDPVDDAVVYPVDRPLLGAVTSESGGDPNACDAVTDLWVLALYARSEWRAALARWERSGRLRMIAANDRLAARRAVAAMFGVTE